jgi:CPA2 family monovalent cation:H+ antiporter-2
MAWARWSGRFRGSIITISDPEAIAPFAEFGIILLLFEIGLELSFNRLWSMRRLVFGLGAMELAGGAL